MGILKRRMPASLWRASLLGLLLGLPSGMSGQEVAVSSGRVSSCTLHRRGLRTN